VDQRKSAGDLLRDLAGCPQDANVTTCSPRGMRDAGAERDLAEPRAPRGGVLPAHDTRSVQRGPSANAVWWWLVTRTRSGTRAYTRCAVCSAQSCSLAPRSSRASLVCPPRHFGRRMLNVRRERAQVLISGGLLRAVDVRESALGHERAGTVLADAVAALEARCLSEMSGDRVEHRSHRYPLRALSPLSVGSRRACQPQARASRRTCVSTLRGAAEARRPRAVALAAVAETRSRTV
jgi:hypothetical protein